MSAPEGDQDLELLEEVEPADQLPEAGRMPDAGFAPDAAPRPGPDATTVLENIQSLNEIRDLDTLLEQVLLRARRLVRADAGTIYLKAKNRLFFSYVQNDTLFAGGTAETRYVYSSRSLPVDKSSLAGYVADTADPLLIDDVYDIRSDVTYSFNPDFDVKAHYKTTSMLIVPLVTREKDVVGVLQLITALNKEQEVIPFADGYGAIVQALASQAGVAVRNAKLTTALKMANLDLFPALEAAPRDAIVVADGTSCRHQIADGTPRRAMHGARLLDQALDG